MSALTADREQLFWAKVNKTDTCWLWTACINSDGYGLFWDGMKSVRAHRVAFELLRGELLPGVELDHDIECPKNCANPAHLRPATHKQNMENRAYAYGGVGVRGVYKRANGTYQAYVMHNRKKHHAGTFKTVDEAASAAQTKRNELFSHNQADRA